MTVPGPSVRVGVVHDDGRVPRGRFQKTILDLVPPSAAPGRGPIGRYLGRTRFGPPAGSDVYLIARLWQWWPMLELEAGQTYRLHLMSMDWLHGFSLQPENINIQVHPGYEHILTVQPTKAGTFSIICNEYCGINHHTMVSRLYVVDRK